MYALHADRDFFAALVAGSVESLAEILSDDFILIDVMMGSEVPREALLDVIGSGQLQFEIIEPAEVRVREYGSTAIVTRRTKMQGRFGGEPFGAHSRYTHVYVEHKGRWRLVAAQGTQIVPPPEPAKL
jgi:ketosteroid isomerase-like protein